MSEEELYWTRIGNDGKSTFFFTGICKNQLYYSDYAPKRYDGCICPRCGRTLKFEKEDISLDDVTL